MPGITINDPTGGAVSPQWGDLRARGSVIPHTVMIRS
jgi:hypothetical protein